LMKAVKHRKLIDFANNPAFGYGTPAANDETSSDSGSEADSDSDTDSDSEFPIDSSTSEFKGRDKLNLRIRKNITEGMFP